MPQKTQAAAGYAVEKGQRKTNASEGAKMKQHITQDAAMAIFSEVTRAGKGYATTQEILNAAIQHYIDQQAKALPGLPEPDVYEYDIETVMNVLKAHSPDQLQAYGAACAAHAREVALSEAQHIARRGLGAMITERDALSRIEQLKAGK